ncbi:MmcQ/YjbR family DNA-binding protein [bacterium]|nr:MmcQ/YjbR family DNA-binding protein [bacterium]
MTLSDYNSFCASLPVTHHVVQWGGAHVWKVGGLQHGKVFAIAGWDDPGDEPQQARITFKVSDIGWEVLRDAPGCRPAPYLASRGMKWIQAHGEPRLPDETLKDYIAQSHAIVAAGFSGKRRRELGLA